MLILVELGLTDRKTVDGKRKRFMIPFFLVMLTALVLIIGRGTGFPISEQLIWKRCFSSK